MTDLGRLLVFSMDDRTLTTLVTSLTAAGGRTIRSSTVAEFRYSMRHIMTFDAAIIDISARPDHLQLIREFAAYFPAKPLIAVLAAADLNNAVQAIRFGATDYLLQPVLAEEVPDAVANALLLDLSHQFQSAQRLGWHRERDLGPVVGTTEEMRQALQLIGEIARKDNHVLFCGEPGVGKTYFARLLHFLSPRRFQPLLKISCAHKTSGDLLLELFGNQSGLLHPSYDATLLLAESHALPTSVQNRLALYIEEQSHVLPTSGLRIIGLSSAPLAQARTGLFTQIASSQLTLPTLQQRYADLEALCTVLLSQISAELSLPAHDLVGESIRLIRGHQLDGNIKELYSILRRAAVISRDLHIESQVLRMAGLDKVGSPDSLQIGVNSLQLDEVEEVLIHKALDKNAGNVSRTAHSLGISRGTLYNKMRKYGMIMQDKQELVNS